MATTFPHAYTIYGVHFDPASGSDTVLNQIDGTPIDLNPTMQGDTHSGNVYPGCIFVSDMRPMSAISTRNIKQALTLIGTEAATITSDVDEFGLSIYAQKLDKYGKRAATGHRRWSIASGMVVARSISANRDGSSYSFEVHAIDNGADPIAVTNSVTLPTLPTTENHYVLDKIVISGVTLPANTEATLNFGVNLDIDKSGGKLFPNWCHIDTVTPDLTVTGFDADWITIAGGAFDIFGAAATHANTIVWLKKRECGKTFYADNTSNHIKITIAGKAQPMRTMGGNGKVTTGISVKGHYNGTDLPILVQMDLAIT